MQCFLWFFLLWFQIDEQVLTREVSKSEEMKEVAT